MAINQEMMIGMMPNGLNSDDRCAYEVGWEKCEEYLLKKEKSEGILAKTIGDTEYDILVKDVRRHLELGMDFGDDPIEQIVFLVHRSLINHTVKGGIDKDNKTTIK